MIDNRDPAWYKTSKNNKNTGNYNDELREMLAKVPLNRDVYECSYIICKYHTMIGYSELLLWSAKFNVRM